MNGTIKWFNSVKGYGFITSSGKDFFFHHSNMRMDRKVRDSIRGGESVSFEETNGPKGIMATEVKLLASNHGSK